MPTDAVPPHLMNEERRAWASSLGLAQRLAYDPTEQAKEAASIAAPPPSISVAPSLSIVGTTVTGRDWLLVQLPGGVIRHAGHETEARAEARRLAAEEGGEFGVFQPRGISRPQTTVTEELL